MSQPASQRIAARSDIDDAGRSPMVPRDEKSGLEVAPVKRKQPNRKRQHKNPKVAVVGAVEPAASNSLQAPQTVFNDASQSTTAETAVLKEKEASQPKERKPRPSKNERARRRKAESAPEPSEPATAKVPSVEAPATATPIESAQGKANPSKGTALQPRKSGQRQAPSSKTSWMLRDTTGSPIRAIEVMSLQPNNTKVSSEGGFQTLCSYNWQMDGTIYVPGAPPKWNPPPLPNVLAKDTGRHFIDQNASRVPKYPFEPIFAALAVMDPSAVLDKVDIMANRNSLRKLVDFSAGKRPDHFCMGLHMVGETLVISREERNAQQMIHGSSNAGYGHNFEKTFTRPDPEMANSSSHHRVIRYHIGPLDCVVRFEVDAYYDDPNAVLDSEFQQPTDEPTGTLSAAVAQLNVADLPPTRFKTRKNPADKSTTVVEKGVFVDPSKLAEIKAKKQSRLSEALPQLWFGRTPYFMNGNHNKGTVHSVSISHAGMEFPRWEEANQDRLRKMVGLLVEIKSIVRGLKGRAAVLVYDDKGGPLKIYVMKNNIGVLPSETITKYWNNGRGNA